MKTGLWIFFSVFYVCFLFSFWQENVEPAFYRKARPQGLLCDFPDVKLLYDHGPLTVGGFRFLEVPPGGAVVEKKLCVPSGIVNARVRIPIMCGDGFAARLEHGGRTYYLDGTNVVEDRFLRWLEVALPEIKSDKFSFSLPAGCAFGADALRDYGRTRIIAAGKSEILPGEAAVEVQWTGENKVSER